MVGVAGADMPMAVGSAGASNVSSEKWEVEFSRFFNFPSCSSYSSASLGLKPLSKAKTSAGGTWLTTSSMAILSLVRSRAGEVHVLSVHVVGRILEEHFISNLNILWPQVSVTSESSSRPSRVLFFSYTNISNKIQKFAVLFSSPCIVQQFLDSIKECSVDIVGHGLPRNFLSCECALLSDLVTPAGTQKINSGESISKAFGSENNCPRQQLLTDGSDVYSPLPPSFTELMHDCLSESAAGGTSAAGGNPADRNIEKRTSNSSLDAVTAEEILRVVEKQMLVGDIDLRSQIERCMSDASFNDMLAKIEMVIEELGGDLSL